MPVENAGDRRAGSRWERERKSSDADEVTRSSRSSSNIQLGEEIEIEEVNNATSRGSEHNSGREMNRRQKNSSSPSSSGASSTDE